MSDPPPPPNSKRQKMSQQLPQLEPVRSISPFSVDLTPIVFGSLEYFGINQIIWAKIKIEGEGTSHVLASSHPMRKADITSLRKGEFQLKSGSWSRQFVRIENSSIWVFVHRGYVSASDAKYKSFNACVEMEYLPPCLGTVRMRNTGYLNLFLLTT